MTKQQIQEAISFHLVELIASKVGQKINPQPYDNGVDFVLLRTNTLTLNGTNYFFESGKTVSVQLKCTTERSIIRSNKSIKYDLRARNYNNLIIRRGNKIERKVNPLLLVLVVLSDDTNQWIVQNTNNKAITLNATIYWYYPNKNQTTTKNKRQVRIEIPVKNVVTTDFLNTIFNYKSWQN